MRGELVALDLETTGLDPAADSIIEVGMVRLHEGIITDEYQTFVNPGRPVPPHVTYLTGITPDDLVGAPALAGVIPAIRTFAGNVPIIGHNIAFDLAFLSRQGILQTNLRIDTYDLASVVLPRAPRYNLASLVSQFDINLDNAHRALADARAAALLYWALWDKVRALPYATLYEITMAAQGLDWDARHVFEAALNEYRGQMPPPPPSDQAMIEQFGLPVLDETPLRPAVRLAPLDTDQITARLRPGGLLAERLPGYEERPQQIEMARAVAAAFNDSDHILIEAGTGTGKSLAYLLPALSWAAQNNERIVISTNTINLQDQLIQNDIPALTTMLDLPVRSVVLKGRSNYLCPRRLAAVRRRHPTQVDELRTLAKILVWLLESPGGDRSDISLRGPVENNVWHRLSAEDEDCTLDRCWAVMQGACPFYKARKAAESAHVLVINHALLLADAVGDNQVLPPYRHLIIDEAQHLEEAATSSLTFRLDEAALQRRLGDLGGPARGLLGDLLTSVRGYVPDKQLERLETFVRHISAATGAMEVHVQALFNSFRDFLRSANGSRAGDYNVQFRITPQHRSLPAFSQCQTAWTTLRDFFEVISTAMRRLTDGLARLESYNIPNYHDLVSGASAASRHLDEIQAQLTAFTLEPSANAIYWLSAGQNANGYVAINSAPLHVGLPLHQHIWSAKDTVVLTSATLQTDDTFDYLRERLHVEHAKTLDVGSPFDYRASTLVYIPNDIPEPNDQSGYQREFERALIELADALNGRLMVLFTSYTHLQQTKQAIAPRLALGNIIVYDQTEGGSRQALLDGFKSSERAVLLGTKSFWEGVDIPGEALSGLVIARLPFAVPSDPIFAARSESYADGFKQYAVPDAVLRFRQGFGRLIRTRTDRGVVVVFDRRIISKSYGVSFLESLPDCTVQYGNLQTLPEAARRWVDGSQV